MPSEGLICDGCKREVDVVRGGKDFWLCEECERGLFAVKRIAVLERALELACKNIHVDGCESNMLRDMFIAKAEAELKETNDDQG